MVSIFFLIKSNLCRPLHHGNRANNANDANDANNANVKGGAGGDGGRSNSPGGARREATSTTLFAGGFGATGQALETRLLKGGRSREVALQVGSMNDAGVQVAWDEEANVLLEGVRAMREARSSPHSSFISAFVQSRSCISALVQSRSRIRFRST